MQSGLSQCTPTGGGISDLTGEAFFNYGSVSGSFNTKNRTSMTVGQMVTGDYFNQKNKGTFGFWGRFLKPPTAPVVTATEGDLLDRIQLNWEVNPFSPEVQSFKIYRASGGFNFIYLDLVDKNTRSYNDFNVIAGTNYTYAIRGVNGYGEGLPGTAIGFQVPNGVATGWMRTQNGNPVTNALVSLSPMQGYSAKFGLTDGATATADAATTGGNFLPTTAAENWSLTFWTKTQSIVGTARVLDINTVLVSPLANGMSISVPGATLAGDFATGAADDWHHTALTFSNGQYRLYLDGVLVALKSGTPVTASGTLNFNAKTNASGQWAGNLDELRIYHRRLDELDLVDVMSGTASSLTPNLKYYWKMDEGAGTKTFDILRRDKLYFCGAKFDAIHPPVATSATTNDDGYYRIEGAYYGTGTTFLATPKKNFYAHRALKLLRDEGGHATLPDFKLTQKSTIEVWVNQSEPNNDETILAKKWGAGGDKQFALHTQAGEIKVTLNGGTSGFGPLGLGCHLLALTIDSTNTSTEIEVFKEGTSVGSHSFPVMDGDMSNPDYPWFVGGIVGSTACFSAV